MTSERDPEWLANLVAALREQVGFALVGKPADVDAGEWLTDPDYERMADEHSTAVVESVAHAFGYIRGVADALGYEREALLKEYGLFPLTGKNITDGDIKALRTRAETRGERPLVRICRLALDEGTVYRTGKQLREARERCARLINEGK